MKKEYAWQDIVDKKQYDQFVQSQLKSDFTQSWNYGLAKENTNHVVCKRGLMINQQLKVVYTGILEKFKLGSRFNIMSGPIGTNGNFDLIESFTNEIRRMSQKYNFIFSRIKPCEEDTAENRDFWRMFKWKKAPISTYHHRGVINLEKKNDTLVLASMNQSLRRQLRKLDQQKIQVKTKTNLKSAQLLYKFYSDNVKRRHQSNSYGQQKILELFKNFQKDGRVAIYQAETDQKILSMTMVFFFGTDAYNYISARTEQDEKYSSSPLLHLAAIGDSRARGLKFYNFGTIVCRDQTNHSYYGFSQFKRSFGVEEIKTIPALDLIIKPARYLPIYVRQKQYKRQNKL